MDSKLKKYHFEEIVLILLILNSDLTKYSKDDLVLFTEFIEGRIDVLFIREFLSVYSDGYGFTGIVISKLEELKSLLTDIYEPEWHKKFIEHSLEMSKARILASQLLFSLGIEYEEPFHYLQEHLHLN